MIDLLFIGGAPGTGKSTLAALLQAALESVWIDFGALRQLHLDPEWSNTSEEEHEMAFENLVFLLRNYLRYGYRNLIVDDLQDWRLGDLSQEFADRSFRIITLVLPDEGEHRERIESRNSGWRDVNRAIAWNRDVLNRPLFPHETRIDASVHDPQTVANRTLQILGAETHEG